jgi:transcriptional regulator with XRE-family HTH domain
MAGKQSLDNDFAARLVSLRSARGVSQQVIADMAGLTQTKYSALERGVHTPRLSPSELVALADGLGVSLATLVGSGSPADRITPIARYADDLTDGDVEALTITARQLASARAAALPSREDFPGWETLSPQARAAFEELEGAVRRAARLRVAEPKATYRAGGNAGGSDGRPRGRRSPGGAASA